MVLPSPVRHFRLSALCGQATFLMMAWLASVGFADDPVSARRAPWTTSRVIGSPEPRAPYKVVRAFPRLKFDHPLLIVRYPEQNRLVVGEQSGVLYSFVDTPEAEADVFFDLRKEIRTIPLLAGAKEIEAVYGLTFHPNFAKNRQCFICYTVKGSKGDERNFPDGTRVSRFRVTQAEPPRVDPSSEEVVIPFLQGGHNGGDLQFGPDGMLYISTGDAASPNPPDPFNTGQDVSDLLSSILRIDVDRKDAGLNYSIPQDNPFVGMAGARGEVWAYGFRNPWRMSFDRETGELFVGDVGWELWETIHRVEKGGNYGWSAMEGPQPIKSEQIGPTPIQPALIELPHTIACSVTGGLVYRGKKFPELNGAYVFGDWETRRLWAARFDGDRTKEMPEIARPSVRFVAFSENHQRELYFLDQDVGTLHTLETNDDAPAASDFPTKLSDTGLFASVKEHEPASGVARFTINGRQWQDGATAEHWAAFPGLSSVALYSIGKPIRGFVDWHNFRMHFPKDAVLMRTLTLEGQRLETQLLHYDGIDWQPYTFAWRDDQTDADLVGADGDEKQVTIGDRKHVWQFHSRSQCMSCHSNQSEYALAFLPEQLNRPGLDGRNQLVALTASGHIRRADNKDNTLPPFDAASAEKQQRLADPNDTSEPLDDRARAYLHANCGHCHSEHGGGTVPLRLQFSVSPAAMNALDLRPTRGDFGLSDARIIKPGDPYASTLYFRMAKFGRDRMPHIGSELPDEAGLTLIAQWIESLQDGAASSNDVQPPAAHDQHLANSRSAMIAARQLGRGELHSAQRDELLMAAAKLPGGPMRDLFEGYLPADESNGPKLGSNPRPKTILVLGGDSKRGESLFWSQTMNCGKCHRIGDRGVEVGPDLSAIGKQRSRAELLESLLAPSRRVEPKYASYLAQTTDGQVITGVLVKRDASAVVLRDAQGKDITLATGDVEALKPSRASLMPEGQLADLTAQDVADLLEFLTTRQ